MDVGGGLPLFVAGSSMECRVFGLILVWSLLWQCVRACTRLSTVGRQCRCYVILALAYCLGSLGFDHHQCCATLFENLSLAWIFRLCYAIQGLGRSYLDQGLCVARYLDNALRVHTAPLPSIKQCLKFLGIPAKQRHFRHMCRNRLRSMSCPMGLTCHQKAMVRCLIFLCMLSTVGAVTTVTSAAAGPALQSIVQAFAELNSNQVVLAGLQELLPRYLHDPLALQKATEMGMPVASIEPLGLREVRMESSFEKDSDGGWIWGHHRDFSPEQFGALQQVVRSRKSTAFAYSVKDLKGYHGPMGPFEIKLKHGEPIFERKRRQSPQDQVIQDEKSNELLNNNLITQSPDETQYASNPLFPAKKDAEGRKVDRRMCIDYRPINEATISDRYGMHHPEDLFQKIGTGSIFSKIDLRSGFHQIPIKEADQPKTSFWWSNKLFMYKFMPFGLKNAPAHFQRVVDFELQRKGLGYCTLSFIDDILIYSDTPDQHIADVAKVLDALSDCGLMAHPDKSVFGTECVEYLGHNVSPFGMTPSDAKVAAIKQLKSPTGVSELRAVLGFLSYYRCYCPNFSIKAAPLNALLRKDAPWIWEEEHEAALTALKDEICTEGKALKRFDPHAPTYLYTDWSAAGIGAVLAQQEPDGQQYMVACISRSCNKHERNYSAFEGEMLAVVWACKTLHVFLDGISFTIVTDHQPLQWLLKSDNGLKGKHARWALCIQGFDFKIQHRPGKSNPADVPSRFPLASQVDTTGARLDSQVVKHDALPSHVAAISQHMQQLHVDDNLPPTSTIEYGKIYADFDFFMQYFHFLHEKKGSEAAVIRHEKKGSRTESEDHLLDCTARSEASFQLTRNAFADRVLASIADQIPLQFPTPVLPAASSTNDLPRLDTSIISTDFFNEAYTQGIVVWDLFGGLGAGLDMALRSGFKVRKYIYTDIDPAAQKVVKSRLNTFLHDCPEQLSCEVVADALTQLPQDVRSITEAELISLLPRLKHRLLFVAGWECQPFSMAGTGQGLASPRAYTYHETVRILATLQRLLPRQAPAYILENAPMQHNARFKRIRDEDFPLICSQLGTPVLVDAARFGAGAHRLRNFWSNLADPAVLHLAISYFHRPKGITADLFLDPGRKAKPALRTEALPFYACNTPGETQSALPTLVAFPRSRAFKNNGPGLILNTQTDTFSEPTPDERERLLSYPVGTTRVEGITEADRHRITGRCIDGQCAVFLMTFMSAIHRHFVPSPSVVVEQPSLNVAVLEYGKSHMMWEHQLPPLPIEQLDLGLGAAIMKKCGWVPGTCLGKPSDHHLLTPILPPSQSKARPRAGLGYQPTSALPIISKGARIAFQPASDPVSFYRPESSSECNILEELITCAVNGNNHHDVWMDQSTIDLLAGGGLHGSHSKVEVQRVTRRAKHYRYTSDGLFRLMADGRWRLVPHPRERMDLILSTHRKNGHLGVRRTVALLSTSHWWHGMDTDVRKYLKTCEQCAQVKVFPMPSQPELHSLPIMGLFYRWGVDLAGPFPTSNVGNRFAMIMIEHLSKHVEVCALPDKLAEHTAAAFQSHVLCRFGAPAEVLTDQGSEFQGAFEALLQEHFIDHRQTSANHPQSDGLAERAVQTFKRALRKHCQEVSSATGWDQYMHFIALGYRASAQMSTKVSPYRLLYGCDPIVPPAIRTRMQQPLLDFSDSSAAADYLLIRAEALHRHCVIATHNLEAAQQKDQAYYRRIRSGNFVKRLREFKEGDFVYKRRSAINSTLQTKYHPNIYQVISVRPQGTIILVGRDGTTFSEHADNLAPCSLTNIDATIDPTLAKIKPSHSCIICDKPDRPHQMVLCDWCNSGYHLQCLDIEVPHVGDASVLWVCPTCTTEGITAIDVQKRRSQAPPPQLEPIIFPNKEQRTRDQQAWQLAGRTVSVNFNGQEQRAVLEYVGRRGQRNPKCLKAHFPGGRVEFYTLAQAKNLLVPQ